jgi:uncharacterized protein YoxC
MSVVDWIGAIAGALAALAFVALVAFLAVPLVKLGRTFDAATQSVKDLTEHTVPVLDETAATVASTNAQLVKVDTVTTSAAEISQNVSALTALVAATVGGPLIKVAAFSYGVRQAVAGLAERFRS